MKCTACGVEVLARARFCVECGHPVAQEHDCAGCGGTVPAGARFCPQCGAPQAMGAGPAAAGTAPLGYCAGSGRAIRATDEHFCCLQCEKAFLEAYRFDEKPVCQQCAYTSGMAQELEAERAEISRIEAERRERAEQAQRAFEQATGFRDHGDGTVTDLRTGLQWMRCSLGQMWDGAICLGEADEFTWDNAHAAVEALNRRGGYAGHRDWRLPSKDELNSIVYCSQGRRDFDEDGQGGGCLGSDYQRPTIDQRVFPDTPSSFFWSASPSAYLSNSAWRVHFNYGDAFGSNRSYGNRVRLVRDGH